MHSYDELRKAQEQAAGMATSNLGCNTVCEKAQAGEEMLFHKLLRRKRQTETEHEKLDRALGILERHPEFQELIELLQSGLV